MVKQFEFEGYKVFKHGKDCAPDSVDIFNLPDSKSYSDMGDEMNLEEMGMMDGMMEGELPDHQMPPLHDEM